MTLIGITLPVTFGVPQKQLQLYFRKKIIHFLKICRAYNVLLGLSNI
jgi:hypothetical protein